MAGSEVIAAARAARRLARAPYSAFQVGAALETAAGEVVTGCNVESASYGLSVCAERVALFTAIAAGHRAFRRIVIVADTAEPTPPCGACRQVLWEYGGDLDVELANLRRVLHRCRLSDLFPHPFVADLLGRRRSPGPG